MTHWCAETAIPHLHAARFGETGFIFFYLRSRSRNWEAQSAPGSRMFFPLWCGEERQTSGAVLKKQSPPSVLPRNPLHVIDKQPALIRTHRRFLSAQLKNDKEARDVWTAVHLIKFWVQHGIVNEIMLYLKLKTLHFSRKKISGKENKRSCDKMS